MSKYYQRMFHYTKFTFVYNFCFLNQHLTLNKWVVGIQVAQMLNQAILDS